jgi:hypothetical protein
MAAINQTISIKDGYVLVERPAGYEVNLSDQKLQLKKIAAACDEVGNRKVLIVGPRTKVNLSVFDIFHLGCLIAKYKLQVAVVELHDASTKDKNFFETVIANRWIPTKFFNNEKDARKFLKIE